MATASRYLCRHLARLSTRPLIRRKCPSAPQCTQSFTRQISSTSIRPANQDQQKDEFDFKSLRKPEKPYTVADLDPQDRASYEVLSKDEQDKYMAVQNHVKAVLESGEIQALTEEQAVLDAKHIERTMDIPRLVEESTMNKFEGIWGQGEDDEHGINEDADNEVSDDLITSVAESELELHREIREYTRIAAWDLPLLLQYAKSFQQPDMKATPLRFRYTTYMGEHHPAAKKVVVEFTTKELAAASSLTEAQRIKLIKLVGVRYNPDKDLVKMSCEKFEEAAQNKRYLGDLIGKIIAEAKDTTDTFEDVPLDLRHHKPKKRHMYPESWKMKGTEDVKKLGEARQTLRLLGEEERAVDGKELLESYVRAKGMTPSLVRPQ